MAKEKKKKKKDSFQDTVYIVSKSINDKMVIGTEKEGLTKEMIFSKMTFDIE